MLVGMRKNLPAGILLIIGLFFLYPSVLPAQSFAPGTGRYWNRNPTSPSMVSSPNKSSAELSVLQQRLDERSRDAEQKEKVAQQMADALKNATDSANQAKFQADEMAKEVEASTQALNQAMRQQLNATQTEQATAAGAVRDAQSKLDQNEKISIKASAAAISALQHQMDVEVAAKDAAVASTAAKSALASARKELSDASAPTAILASKGGYGFSQQINVVAGNPSGLACSIDKSGSKDFTTDFKVENNCQHVGAGQPCVIVVGFHPSGTDDEQVQLNYGNVSTTISGHVVPNINTAALPNHWLPLNRKPAAPLELAGLGAKLEEDFGVMLDVSTAFWSQESSLSYLNQTQFFYNSSSSSSTLKADVASMVFPGGTQLTLATNIPVGTSNTTPSSTTKTTSAVRANTTSTTPPSMSATQSAQAAQNLVDGGNLLLRASWPLLWYVPKYKSIALYNLVVGRDGLDIPNFSGANTVATDPVNHFNISNEWYAQFDALPAKQGGDSQGSIFVDAKYGLDYVSAAFARQAGFVNNWNKGFLSQLSGGLVFSGKLSIVASRNFGPDQTWTDATSGSTVTKNNFRTWSVGVKYATNQSK